MEDDCLRFGMYRTENGDCEACPKGTFLADPLSPCSSDSSTCCSSNWFQWNGTHVCHDKSKLEHGLQLFRRGPGRHTTWCPKTTENPWLFDLAKSLGYITFFGDE